MSQLTVDHIETDLMAVILKIDQYQYGCSVLEKNYHLKFGAMASVRILLNNIVGLGHLPRFNLLLLFVLSPEIDLTTMKCEHPEKHRQNHLCWHSY